MALLFRRQMLRPNRLQSRAFFSSVPIIDVNALVKRRSSSKQEDEARVMEVVKEIDDACRNVGFFYVKGHGVPLELVDQVRKLGHEFFSLKAEEKRKVKLSGASGWRGYQTLGENLTKGVADLHEALDFIQDYDGNFPASMRDNPLLGRNLWPVSPKSFRPMYEQYLNLVRDLGRSIMGGIGLALAGSRETFEGNRAGDPFWFMRVIGYPPIVQKVTEPGCGEHTDYGLLTLVNQDNDVQALQVRNQAGEWIWVDPIPGTFVVNIGDMLKVWSNGIYSPTVHRVLNSDSKFRVSVPYFYEPNFDAVVEPLEVCKEKTGGISKYPPVVYGDYLTAKVLTNFGYS